MFNFNFGKRDILGNLSRSFGSKFGSRNSRFTGEYKVIKQEELKDFIKQDVCILDVRTESEFKGMRIKNAINVPLNLLNRDILSIVPDKETKILVYCVVGDRTLVAIQKLNSLGYKNLYIWGNGGLNTLKIKEILEY